MTDINALNLAHAHLLRCEARIEEINAEATRDRDDYTSERPDGWYEAHAASQEAKASLLRVQADLIEAGEIPSEIEVLGKLAEAINNMRWMGVKL
jgi:hypothetical protein